MMSNLKIRVNAASRHSLFLLGGGGPLSTENSAPDLHSVAASPSKVLGANFADAQRVEWRTAPQEA